MKIVSLILIVACCCLCACNKSAPVSASNPQPKPSDAAQQKLRDFAGPIATDCGRLNAGVPSDQAKATADCALKAHQEKRPFYVAYDMPGMAVGVSGNAEGKHSLAVKRMRRLYLSYYEFKQWAKTKTPLSRLLVDYSAVLIDK